ncbi:MAG: SIS domain-containing protein [Candidatus Latescibacteria bacterium]|nr:SIS domain-containing protein [Candidatus Latescibacterota bacterium]
MTRFADDMQKELAARADLIASLDAEVALRMSDIATGVIASLRAGGTIYACGNGGSATQAAHFAAELVGRYKKDRAALPAFALGENSAVVTSLSNDYSFDDVFARQIAGIGRRGDCLLALSTSGTSRNVVRACRVAADKGVHVFALTGAGGGEMARLAEVTVAVPSSDTPHVQELHLAILHILCRVVEAEMFPATP